MNVARTVIHLLVFWHDYNRRLPNGDVGVLVWGGLQAPSDHEPHVYVRRVVHVVGRQRVIQQTCQALR